MFWFGLEILHTDQGLAASAWCALCWERRGDLLSSVRTDQPRTTQLPARTTPWTRPVTSSPWSTQRAPRCR